jgi:hypothetical protein
MADPVVATAQARGFKDLFNEALKDRGYDPDAGRWDAIKHNSVASGILPWSEDRRYANVFGNDNLSPQAKAGYAVGRLVRDFIGDGTRTIWWVGNHPLGATSIAGEIASDAAGFRPTKAEIQDLEQRLNVNREGAIEQWSKDKGFAHAAGESGIPLEVASAVLPLAGSLALVSASGTHDLANFAEGGRTPGYEAVYNDGIDEAQSTNVPGELATRYFLGRSGRLLPWEQFTAERPEISPGDYEAYRAHQFDRGALDLNLFRATDRNLTGEPEFTMMGFQVPLSGAASAGGALIGGVAGARELDALIQRRYADRLEQVPKNLAMLKTTAGRRVAGAALGALAGAISGRLGATAINDIVIQPALNPQAVANQEAWEQQQRALGLL